MALKRWRNCLPLLRMTSAISKAGRVMGPDANQFTPAEKLTESQSCSVRGACGFVQTGFYEKVIKVKADVAAVLGRVNTI
jgi:hypothetical protein